MPLTPCPGCNRYVQVPDVRDAQLFRCPTCLINRDKLLYRCNSCMKVSIVTLGAKVCPKCSTIVRPNVRNLLQPQVVAPSVPTDWIYHTTNIKIANSIKRIGLRSSFTRTGSDLAYPEGAFARNREMRLALPLSDKGNPIMHRLRKGVAYLVCLGKTNVEILDLDLAPPAIAFVPTGNDTDSANLAAKCDSALVELATLAGCMNAPTTIWNANNFKNVRNSANVNTLATQLAGRQAHCLTVWARQDTTLYYQVEEFKTVRNVYFLKQKDAAVGYKSYTKGLSKAIIVVLRVRRALIVGLVDDFSDHMAERTPITVLPNVIEIFVALNPDWFCNPHYRDNNANWINIRDWGV